MTHAVHPHSIVRRTGLDFILKHQMQLLEQARFLYRDTPIRKTTEQTFLAVPRHAFVLIACSKAHNLRAVGDQKFAPEPFYRW